MKLDEITILKLSKAKEGDILLIRSDDINQNTITALKRAYKRLNPNSPNIAIVGMPRSDTMVLKDREEFKAELRSLLESLETEKYE